MALDPIWLLAAILLAIAAGGVWGVFRISRPPRVRRGSHRTRDLPHD